MANIAAVLKDEITRLARKELRNETEGLKKASAQYRSDIAALKRLTAQLEKQILRLEKAAAKDVEVSAQQEQPNQARFTAKGFKTLRLRLGLSAAEAGSLLGVSPQAIYSWEAGSSKPREQQMNKVVVLRGMGKKEVRTLLQEHSPQAAMASSN